jgi:hypothetical protein
MVLFECLVYCERSLGMVLSLLGDFGWELSRLEGGGCVVKSKAEHETRFWFRSVFHMILHSPSSLKPFKSDR